MSPDISMCNGENTKTNPSGKVLKTGENVCPIREKCFRFKAKPSYYQSYSSFMSALNKGKTECKYFMEIWT